MASLMSISIFLSATLSTSMSATTPVVKIENNAFVKVETQIPGEGTKINFYSRGHRVQLHVGLFSSSFFVGHHNVVSTLCECSEALTEWKSESITDLRTFLPTGLRILKHPHPTKMLKLTGGGCQRVRQDHLHRPEEEWQG